ncbi:MAG: restriction endonuclease subunit S [Roseateles sp.]|nr:MAG: restriction endonuclease subunit S [Roseateles sp.]
MRLPRYPAYRDSGTAWLGRVPAHWAPNKLKYVATFSGGGTPNRDVPAYWNGDIPWVSPKDMKAESIQGAEECITAVGLSNSTANLIEPGHVLMVVRSGILKHTIPVAINHVPVALNQDMKAISMDRAKCEPTFFARWVQGLNDDLLLAWAKQGATVESIEQAYLADTPLPLPPIAEQRDICRFLDHETAKIDGLIAEQEKLIALLAEKRQATISHAVTRGLNPQAPMKDSGVPWLGEVPAHWGVTRLKYAADAVVDCPHETPTYADDGAYRVIRTADVSEGRLHVEAMFAVAEHEFRQRIRRMSLEKGDVVYGREGERWGFAAQVPESDVFCLGQRMMQFRAAACMHARFLMWQLNAQSTYRQGQVDTVGATSPHVNVSTIKNYALSEPPVGEQIEISSFLDAETVKLDRLDSEAQRTILLLRERRSALIAAAVTGQIDVRGFTAA